MARSEPTPAGRLSRAHVLPAFTVRTTKPVPEALKPAASQTVVDGQATPLSSPTAGGYEAATDHRGAVADAGAAGAKDGTTTSTLPIADHVAIVRHRLRRVGSRRICALLAP
jgi:hypothetical protein